MINEILRRAIASSGMELEELARVAEVDPKTVSRWIGGRVPHERHRLAVAAALGVEEHALWPRAARRRPDGLDELVGVFPRRDDPGAPDWRALLRAAERHVDLLGYSLHELAQARQINKTLAAKAQAGCAVRICLADPGCEAVALADTAERPPGKLTARIRQARERLIDLTAVAGVELREHQVATVHTIRRFDDDLLFTIHVHGAPGFQAPLLWLRRRYDYGAFDQLERHFEEVWATATPLSPDGGEPRAAAAARERAMPGDEFLERLDYVWRPGR